MLIFKVLKRYHNERKNKNKTRKWKWKNKVFTIKQQPENKKYVHIYFLNQNKIQKRALMKKDSI